MKDMLLFLEETSGASIESIMQLLLGSTGAVAAMVLGLRWLNSDRDKLVVALAQERDARIKVLEEASKRCADDRQEMHKEILSLQAEVRELYRRIATIAAGDEDINTQTSRVRLLSPVGTVPTEKPIQS